MVEQPGESPSYVDREHVAAEADRSVGRGPGRVRVFQYLYDCEIAQ